MYSVYNYIIGAIGPRYAGPDDQGMARL